MPADVVRRVQGAVGVRRDEHGLTQHLDDRDPLRLVETEVGATSDAGPLAEEHPVALALPGRGVDVQLAWERGLQGHVAAPSVEPVETRASTR